MKSHNEMQHWIFMQSCKQGSLAAVTTSPDGRSEGKEQVSEFPQETTQLSVQK